MDETHPAHFDGSQNRAPAFEAHIFFVAAEDEAGAAAEVLQIAGFRLSSRSRPRKDGRIDAIATHNGNDRQTVECATREGADLLTRAGIGVYRIRLEQMVFDEVATPRARNSYGRTPKATLEAQPRS